MSGMCDEVREQPDGKDEPTTTSDDLDLDPRVEGELDNLNKASNDINILEKELDEARAVFRQRLTDAARSLKQLAKSLGNSVDRARPYFEALKQSKKAQLECQNAAMTYERACQVHKGARDTIHVAEDKLRHNPAMFDQAWQEMLNTANTKLMEAEKEKLKNEGMHLEAALAYRELEVRATQLERQLRKNVNKARPYFEQRDIYHACLEAQKGRVLELETAYLEAKSQYSQTLRNLELISEDIHRQRNTNNCTPTSSVLSTPTATREDGVGAEVTVENNDKTDTVVRRRINSEEAVQKTSIEHQKIEQKTSRVATGRFRSSLVLDLDMDIELGDGIDISPPSKPSPQPQQTSKGGADRQPPVKNNEGSIPVTLKHYDDYQVLDIMPFLEREKERKRGLLRSVNTTNTTTNTNYTITHVEEDSLSSHAGRDSLSSHSGSSTRRGSKARSNNTMSSNAMSSRVLDDDQYHHIELSEQPTCSKNVVCSDTTDVVDGTVQGVSGLRIEGNGKSLNSSCDDKDFDRITESL